MTLRISTILIGLAASLNLVFFSSALRAETQETVVGLSQGACWVSPQSSPVKVAAFNQNLSAGLSKRYLSKGLQSLEGDVFNDLRLEIDWPKGESFLHCSGHSTYYVMNLPLQDSSKRICGWFELNPRGVSLASWGMADGPGFCDGIKAGEYVVGLASGVSGEEEIQQYVANADWRDEVIEVERLTDNYWYLKVTPSFAFEHKDFRGELLNSGPFQSVEREKTYHPVGESLKIKNPLKPY